MFLCRRFLCPAKWVFTKLSRGRKSCLSITIDSCVFWSVQRHFFVCHCDRGILWANTMRSSPSFVLNLPSDVGLSLNNALPDRFIYSITIVCWQVLKPNFFKYICQYQQHLDCNAQQDRRGHARKSCDESMVT